MSKSRSLRETNFPPSPGDLRRSAAVPGKHSERDRFAIAQGFRMLRSLKQPGESGAHFAVLKEGGLTWTSRWYVPQPTRRRVAREARWAFATVRVTGLEGRKAVALADQWQCS